MIGLFRVLCIFLVSFSVAAANYESTCRAALTEAIDITAGLVACTHVIDNGRKVAWPYASRGSLFARRSKTHYGHEADSEIAEDLSSALGDLTQAIEIEPLNGTYFGLRGLTWARRAEIVGRRPEYLYAIADLSRAIELDPRTGAWVYEVRAKLHHKNGESLLSLADITRALSYAPDVSLLVLRGSILEDLGERARALADYRTGLALDPHNQRITDALKRLGAM